MSNDATYAASSDPSSGMAGLVEHWRQLQRPLPPTGPIRFSISNVREAPSPDPLESSGLDQQKSAPNRPELVVPFAFALEGQTTDDGLMIASVGIAWDALLREIERNPYFLYSFDPRKLEELVAARYHQAGWKVTLTPRSGDRGRDVIAVHENFKIRIFDEVKCYAPGVKIDAAIVRALYGVMSLDQNVSKGVITTTADFAPGIEKEFAEVIPFRLSLRNGQQLATWLVQSAANLGM